jgi:hypothetical protein
MDQDYPAAHSMDTFWYAVDRVGQVAIFDTGESTQRQIRPTATRLEYRSMSSMNWSNCAPKS